ARFDLEVTYRQFLVASILPSVLFVVSCLTLILCQRSVVVGDDAKMRFKGCVSTDTILPPGSKNNSQHNLGDGGGGGTDSAFLYCKKNETVQHIIYLMTFSH
uniref:Uncharacterized protein n=1 Tax=Lutzomyia longipalpis TaxID=7200 RepID=A0A1B0CX43_LUTLO